MQTRIVRAFGFTVVPVLVLVLAGCGSSSSSSSAGSSGAASSTSAPSTGGKHVRIRAIVSDEELVFEIVDEGPGFDLDECTRDCTLEENLTKEEGRGLFLMRQLMDRVESFRNQGNVVRLTLHRE